MFYPDLKHVLSIEIISKLPLETFEGIFLLLLLICCTGPGNDDCAVRRTTRRGEASSWDSI